MAKVNKLKGRDTVILNLTDLHFGADGDYAAETVERVLHHTVSVLVDRVCPDLITVSGDLANEGDLETFRSISEYLNSFGIPWAPIMGNHDNRMSDSDKARLADIYASFSYCLFEAGDPSLGFGNYTVTFEEDGLPVSALFMMDSHDESVLLIDGKEKYVCDQLSDPQLRWYAARAEELTSRGCGDTALIIHIPPYACDEAYKAAWRHDVRVEEIDPRDTCGADVWREGYRDSFGINYEPVTCCHPMDNGLLELLLKIGSTKHVIFGHEHVNNASICYRGVRFTYGTTTGCGGFFDVRMNGGTVLTLDGCGKMTVRHEYVDVRHLID